MITVSNLNDYRGLIATAVQEAGNSLGSDVHDDIIQDVIVEALEKLVAGEVTPTWLCMRAKSRVVDYMRREDNNTLSLDEFRDEDGLEIEALPPSLWDLETPEGMYAIREFIADACDEDRELIELLMEGNTQAEIASELGCSQQTVSNWIADLRRRMP